ncbi:MAG TPA: serine hydrolase [Propionicimonas sp.]|uniref:serine hydrolase domain-containing protein n=1 Tax=Propionicimonas sp. TaxID=1955623 RepID=UPI002F429E2C
MDAVAARPELELHGLVVRRDGRPVLEQYWAPYVAGDRALVYSASKTFTASAIALAVGEGLLALDDRIVDLLPGAWAAVVGPTESVAQLTVHHVLSMSTGHDADVLERFDPAAPQEWARSFLSTPPQTPVGSRHVYNNGASWLLGELIRERTGHDLLDYLRPRLLEPLGIDATWDRDALGRCLGWSGIHVRTRDLATIGELYRCDGVWEGRRLLPEGWVARATTSRIPTEEPNPDWNLGYGYQLWLGREGYRLDGAFGQFSLVLPERGLVIAITSNQSATQLLLDLVWDLLLPELDAGSIPEEGSSAAQLPVPADSGLGSDWSTHGPALVDATLVSSPDEQANLPDLTAAHAHRDATALGVGFTTNGQQVELTAGIGTWVRQHVRLGDVTVPVAAAAGSDADGALGVRLVFTDSPHTLHLRLAGATARMAWATTPLQGGDLAGLVAR